MKKALVKCMSLILILCILSPIAVFAREGGSIGNNGVSWTLDSNGVLTIAGSGAILSVPWQGSKEDIKSVIIEEGITKICDEAFDGCINLTDVSLPDSIVTIGNSAFSNCVALESINLEDGVETIGGGAFSGCSTLSELKLPDSVLEIGTGAFSSCEALTEMVIPGGVTELHAELFKKCTNLKKVDIPEGIGDIPTSCFSSCEALEEVNIPCSVKVIGNNAFKDCVRLENITLPQKLEEIMVYAFCGCRSLKSIEIPENTLLIGYGAFKDCESLEAIKLPSGIEVINSYLFLGCTKLKECILPSKVTYIGECVFYNCENLESVIFPSGINKVPYKTFCNCYSLSAVTIPSGIISVNKSAFNGCDSLEAVYFAGARDEWDAIDFLLGNEALSDAEIICDVPGIKGVKVAPINDGVVNLEVGLSGYNHGGKLFAVMYDDNGTEKVVSAKPEKNLKIPFDGAEYGKKYKMFWWEDAEGLNPVINHIEGSIEEYVPKLEYGYLTDVAKKADGVAMTIFTTDGEFVQVDCAASLLIDEEKYSAADKDILNLFEYNAQHANSENQYAENYEYHQMIMYQTNYEGKIDEIHTVLSTTNSNISSVMNGEETYFVPAENRTYKYAAKSFTDFKVSSATKVLFVPDDRESYDEYIWLSHIDAFSNANEYYVEAYGMTSTGKASLVVMYHNNDYSIYTSKSPWMIVQSVEKIDDENVVVGYSGTSYDEIKVAISEDMEKSLADIENGDVIRYLVNRNGEMLDYQIWYDMSNPCQLTPVTDNDDLYDDGDITTDGANRIIEIHSTSITPRKNYPNATFRLQYGTVEEIVLNPSSEAYITISGVIEEDGLEIDYFYNESSSNDSTISPKITDSVKVFGYDKASGVVTNADLSKVADYITYKNDATRVIAYTATGVLRAIYIVDAGYKNPDIIPEPEEVTGMGTYAYLCSVEPSLEEGYNKELRFFNTSGDFYQVSVADKLEIDGKVYDTSETEFFEVLKEAAIKANENYSDAQNVTYQQPVIYFKKDGTITKLHTVLNEEDCNISAVMNNDEDVYFAPAKERTYKASSKTFSDFKVLSYTKIMFVPDDRTDYDNYMTFSHSNAFSNGRTYNVEGYGLSSSGTAQLVLMYSQNDSVIYTYASPWMIVHSKVETAEGLCIKGYTGTSYSLKSVHINEKDCPSVEDIGKGDIIRYLVDGWGYMTDYQIWFDMSGPCQLTPVTNNDDLYDDGDITTDGANRIIEIHSSSTITRKNYPNATFRLQYGTVTDMLLTKEGEEAVDEEFITISGVITEDKLDMDYFEKESADNNSTISKTIGSSVKVFSFDRGVENAEVVTEADLSDVLTYAEHGDKASRVVAYTAGGTLRAIYIIKD